MTKRELILWAVLAALGGPFFVSLLFSRVSVAGVDVPRWLIWVASILLWFGGAATQRRAARVAAGFLFLQTVTIGFGWRDDAFFGWWLLQTLLFFGVAVLLELHVFPGAGPQPPSREPAVAQRLARMTRMTAIHDRRRAARR